MECKKALRVIELFAGVGGFRLGLEGAGGEEKREARFNVVWSNQWEPSTRVQHASDVYSARWGASGHCNESIFDVVADPARFSAVADAQPEMLVGGFPCQDYSVAKPASSASGIEGKKGVLWWAIYETLKRQSDAGHPVKYLLLENVDRLLKSPTKCRGRDFAIILASLASLGYAVEWRVVNAADYGFPQRRRRIFILGYHRSTRLHEQAVAASVPHAAAAWLSRAGVLAASLPVQPLEADTLSRLALDDNILATQARFTPAAKGRSPFESSGLVVAGSVWTAKVKPAAITDFTPYCGQKAPMTLGDVIRATGDVASTYWLDDDSLAQWRYLKGGKKESRRAASGFEYDYCEGPIAFPDSLERPSRTLITGEGGRAPSRFKHVVEVDGRLRRLVPEELETLNGFPPGFTEHPGVSEAKRAFLMGNALVVGIVRRIGEELARRHDIADADKAALLRSLGSDDRYDAAA